MKSLIVCLLFTISSIHLVYSSEIPESLIYNSKGQLIANTNFRISKKQLKKFIQVERDFIKSILDSLKGEPTLTDDGIEYQTIVSFEVDYKAYIRSIKIEYARFTYDKDRRTDSSARALVTKYSDKMIINPILSFGCTLKLKANKKKVEKYYLPIQFEVDKTLGK